MWKRLYKISSFSFSGTSTFKHSPIHHQLAILMYEFLDIYVILESVRITR